MYSVTYEIIHIADRADLFVVAETDDGVSAYTAGECAAMLDELAPGEAFVFHGMVPRPIAIATYRTPSPLWTDHGRYDEPTAYEGLTSRELNITTVEDV